MHNLIALQMEHSRRLLPQMSSIKSTCIGLAGHAAPLWKQMSVFQSFCTSLVDLVCWQQV